MILSNKYLIKNKYQGSYIWIYAALIGILSYLILEFVKCGDELSLWQVIDHNSEEDILINYVEVFQASIIAILITISCVVLNWSEIDFKVLNYIGITAKTSSLEGFASFLKETEVVYILDFKNRIAYSGWREAHTASDKVREIILSSVSIYMISEDFTLSDFTVNNTRAQFDEMFLSFGIDEPISIISSDEFTEKEG